MSSAFDPRSGLIVVNAELWGPHGSGVLSLALDTGATSTVVSQSRLLQLGYDPTAHSDRVQATTGSGVVFVLRITLSRIAALGQEHADFPVLGHTLPPGAGVDGLLGLDFMRGYRLTVDFRDGHVGLG